MNGAVLAVHQEYPRMALANVTAPPVGYVAFFVDDADGHFKQKDSASVITDLTLTGSGGGSPAGTTTQVQFNDGGVFGAISTFLFDKVQNLLTVTRAYFTDSIGVGQTNQGNAYIEILTNGVKQGLQIVNSAVTNIAFSTFVTADNFVRFVFLGDGKMEWGAGSTLADTNLYRSQANTLTTDDKFEARGGLRVATTSIVGYRLEAIDAIGNADWKIPTQYNSSVANQTGFATDTYLVGSSIPVPATALKAKTMYKCIFNVVKTAAGVATPIINIRIGTLGTTADASRGTLTFSAQTAVIDEGTYELTAIFRTVGSGTSAVIQTHCKLTHRLSITGLGVGVSEPEIATSAGFDSTVANPIIGLSVNGGASAAWTVSIVTAELCNLV